MRLKLHTDYALRTLIVISSHDENDWVQGAEIADTFQISKGHVLKVIQRISALGYVETKRGVGGGARLIMKPNQILLGRLIRELEGDDLLPCVGQSKSNCVLHHQCRLRALLRTAQDQFYETLDQYTLEDLTVDSINSSISNGIVLIEG